MKLTREDMRIGRKLYMKTEIVGITDNCVELADGTGENYYFDMDDLDHIEFKDPTKKEQKDELKTKLDVLACEMVKLAEKRDVLEAELKGVR